MELVEQKPDKKRIKNEKCNFLADLLPAWPSSTNNEKPNFSAILPAVKSEPMEQTEAILPIVKKEPESQGSRNLPNAEENQVQLNKPKPPSNNSNDSNNNSENTQPESKQKIKQIIWDLKQPKEKKNSYEPRKAWKRPYKHENYFNQNQEYRNYSNYVSSCWNYNEDSYQYNDDDFCDSYNYQYNCFNTSQNFRNDWYNNNGYLKYNRYSWYAKNYKKTKPSYQKNLSTSGQNSLNDRSITQNVLNPKSLSENFEQAHSSSQTVQNSAQNTTKAKNVLNFDNEVKNVNKNDFLIDLTQNENEELEKNDVTSKIKKQQNIITIDLTKKRKINANQIVDTIFLDDFGEIISSDKSKNNNTQKRDNMDGNIITVSKTTQTNQGDNNAKKDEAEIKKQNVKDTEKNSLKETEERNDTDKNILFTENDTETLDQTKKSECPILKKIFRVGEEKVNGVPPMKKMQTVKSNLPNKFPANATVKNLCSITTSFKNINEDNDSKSESQVPTTSNIDFSKNIKHEEKKINPDLNNENGDKKSTTLPKVVHSLLKDVQYLRDITVKVKQELIDHLTKN